MIPLRALPFLLMMTGGGAFAQESPAGAEKKPSPQLDFANAVLAEQRGDREAAAEGFEKAREEDPDALPLVQRGVSLRMARGDAEGAMTLYRELAARQADRLEVQLIYADFLRESDPTDDFVAKDATAVLETARKKFPDDPGLIRRLFRLYEQREKREQSRALFDLLLAPDPPVPGKVLMAAEFAKTLFSREDKSAFERLDAAFRDAVKNRPGDSNLARTASENFRARGNLQEAIEVLRIHTQAEPSSLELRTRMAVLMLSAGQQQEGEKELLDVIAIDPRQGLAQQSLAKLYRQQDKVADALPHAAEALKVRGGSPEDFVQLAAEFLDADRPRDARLLLEKAIYYHPDDAGLAAKLAIATRRDPETRAKASRLFREAEQLAGPGGPAAEPEFLVESSESLVEGGQKTAAEERLRQAIRAYPPEQKKESATAMRRLATLWQEQGKNADAAASLLKRAAALDPTPP